VGAIGFCGCGWSEQDLMTYSWKDVPPILSHLNLGRERFEVQFDCAVVFVVPLFAVKSQKIYPEDKIMISITRCSSFLNLKGETQYF
jgi:hypothetical protein